VSHRLIWEVLLVFGGLSPGGTVIPVPCGNVTVVCSGGASSPTLTPPGYYSAPAALASYNASTLAQAVECVPGSYCVNGLVVPCPAATYQPSTRRGAVGECQLCPAGAFCPSSSSAPTPCGNDSLYVGRERGCDFFCALYEPLGCGGCAPCRYCPAGSALPIAAGLGYMTVGVAGGRTARTLCPQGQYCPGDGLAYDCPAG
jgi:hypothetical protein